MAILEAVKLSLGKSGTSRDTDIISTIEAAKHDLRMRGVQLIIDTDPVTERAIIQYCRAWYNFQGEGERYQKAYESMSNAMALDADYAMEGGGWSV